MVRDMTEQDFPALQDAIDRDKFHPGEWKVADFTNVEEEGVYHPAVSAQVVEDRKGPIAFVRYTKVLRVACVWNDADDTARNARGVIAGIHHAVQLARSSGFSEIIILSKHEKLSKFLVDALKMDKRGDEHLLRV